MKKLWLDDEREAPEGFIRAYNAIDAIAAYQTVGPFDVLSLDHDLGFVVYPGQETEGMCDAQSWTGYDFLKWVSRSVPMNHWPDEVLCHSQNPVGRENILKFWQSMKRMKAEAV
ncbi:MAG: cyclic-phosphate processing receiver domain-containing protein [Patescibacteria group bacterium]